VAYAFPSPYLSSRTSCDRSLNGNEFESTHLKLLICTHGCNGKIDAIQPKNAAVRSTKLLQAYGQGRTATSRLSIVSSIAKWQAMAIVLMSFEYSFQCLR
jgi:hypothetical protein